MSFPPLSAVPSTRQRSTPSLLRPPRCRAARRSSGRRAAGHSRRARPLKHPPSRLSPRATASGVRTARGGTRCARVARPTRASRLQSPPHGAHLMGVDGVDVSLAAMHTGVAFGSPPLLSPPFSSLPFPPTPPLNPSRLPQEHYETPHTSTAHAAPQGGDNRLPILLAMLFVISIDDRTSMYVYDYGSTGRVCLLGIRSTGHGPNTVTPPRR